MNVELETPYSCVEVIQSKKSKERILAMKDEIYSLRRNEICILTDAPKMFNIIDCKWVFNIETDITRQEKLKLS